MKDKIQKIREEVVRLKSQLLRGACSSQVAMETRCKEEAYNEVLGILDTMQEEPVNEELEEAALLYYPKMSRISEPHGIIPADNESHYLGDANEDNRKAFKVGANWQKQQMINGAVEATVCGVGSGNGEFMKAGEYSVCCDVPRSNIGDKVKVIVIKEK